MDPRIARLDAATDAVIQGIQGAVRSFEEHSATCPRCGPLDPGRFCTRGVALREEVMELLRGLTGALVNASEHVSGTSFDEILAAFGEERESKGGG